MRAAVEDEVGALKEQARHEEARQLLEEYDRFVLREGKGSLFNRHRVRELLPPILLALGEAEAARNVAEEGIREITEGHARALAKQAGLPQGTLLEGAEKNTLANWNEGHLQLVLVRYHTWLGTALHVLGLVEMASDELARARAGFEAAVETGVSVERARRDLWQLESNVLGGQFDPEGFLSFVENLERSTAASEPANAEIVAIIRAHLGACLTEQARLAPERWAKEARGRLEAVLASKLLGGRKRIEPELSLCELDIREGRFEEARARLARVDEYLGQGPARTLHAQYATFKTEEAELAIAAPQLAGGSEALSRLRQELADLLAASVRQFQGLELRPGGHGLLNYRDKRGLLSELMRLEMLLDAGPRGIERALQHVLSIEAASTLGRRLGAAPASLEDIRGRLLHGNAKHVLLQYVFGPDRSHVFLVDTKEVRHFPLACKDALERLLLDAAGELGSAPPREQRAPHAARSLPKLTRLAEELFPPALRAGLEDCERITLLGREMLGSVPFEALPCVKGRALGLQAAISDLPTAAVGLHLVERAARRIGDRALPERIALLGLPACARLGVRAEELAATLEPFEEQRRALRLGIASTPQALRDGSRTARGLIVFTHGRRDFGRVDPALLLFQGASERDELWLGAQELGSADTPELVVLMACGADFEMARRGDAGSAGLAGALLGGSKRTCCVVLSSYDLDSGAALALTRLLNEALAGGRDPALALCEARRTMAASAEFADPFYWGLLRIVGAGHEDVFPK